VAVELKAGPPLEKPVSLAAIKAEPALAKMTLLRISRLSVQPVTKAEFDAVLKLAHPRPPSSIASGGKSAARPT
jgi:predicted RNA-binding protein with PUA-like domain